MKKIKRKRKIRVNEKIIIPIFIIIIILLVFVYGRIIQKHLINRNFTNYALDVASKNENPIFKISRIVICSSANAIDNSEDQSLQDLSVYQYSDIAVYIDNGEELSNENTISELYIDNISIENDSEIGVKSLKYKNLLTFGAKDVENVNKNLENEPINFKILYTNEENEQNDYNEPSFYTDCSNPITLQYVNSELKNGYKISENEAINFDGSILKSSGIAISDINTKIKFKINIVNNEKENFSCWVNFKLPIDDIYEGTSMKAQSPKGFRYQFFRS